MCKNWSRIRIVIRWMSDPDTDRDQKGMSDPDTDRDQTGMSDPETDRHQDDADPQNCICILH